MEGCVAGSVFLFCMQVVGLPTLRMSKGRDLVLDEGKLVIPRNTTIWRKRGRKKEREEREKDPHSFLPERWLEPDTEYMPMHGTTTVLVQSPHQLSMYAQSSLRGLAASRPDCKAIHCPRENLWYWHSAYHLDVPYCTMFVLLQPQAPCCRSCNA